MAIEVELEQCGVIRKELGKIKGENRTKQKGSRHSQVVADLCHLR
jgi:hypothetical protein